MERNDACQTMVGNTWEVSLSSSVFTVVSSCVNPYIDFSYCSADREDGTTNLKQQSLEDLSSQHLEPWFVISQKVILIYFQNIPHKSS
jgi:hypothetical protein